MDNHTPTATTTCLQTRQMNTLFHGSCQTILCRCESDTDTDTADNSNSDVDCVCVDHLCALYSKNYTKNYIVYAYVERLLVEEVYNMLTDKSNDNREDHHKEDQREWVIRLLRWILAPICHVSAPELSFVANTDSQTLDIYNSCPMFNPKEMMPLFSLQI
jgi:hypothetical protein